MLFLTSLTVVGERNGLHDWDDAVDSVMQLSGVYADLDRARPGCSCQSASARKERNLSSVHDRRPVRRTHLPPPSHTHIIIAFERLLSYEQQQIGPRLTRQPADVLFW